MSARVSVASVTRSDDTTQYAVGDVIGASGLMTIGVDSNDGEIRSAILIDSVVAGGTKLASDLLIYSSAPTVAADNAAFAPTDAQQLNLVAVVPFATADFKAAATNGHTVAALTYPIPYETQGNTLYGVLIARSTYSPSALETFTVKLGLVN